MTFDEARAFVARYTYKPNVKLELIESSGRGWNLMIICTVPDSRPPHTVDRVTHHNILNSEAVNSTNLSFFVQHSIKTVELHELDEWLKFDGKQLNNPHANGV